MAKLVDKTSLSSSDSEEEEIPLTSTEDLSLIKPYDSTVEVVGYVDGIESSRIVGQHNHKIFKFFINNGMSDRVQIIAWNKEVVRVEDRIRPNEIIHIDGAYCKPCTNMNFNKGTVSYELIIQSNTIINILGKYNINSAIPNYEPELVDLAEIGDTTKCIKIQGYIKSNFAIIERQKNSGIEMNCGSITDGFYKLEIRTMADLYELELMKGEKIEVTGFLQRNAVPVHLLAKSVTDFRKIKSKKMKLAELLKGNRTVELKKTSHETDLPGPSGKRTKL